MCFNCVQREGFINGWRWAHDDLLKFEWYKYIWNLFNAYENTYINSVCWKVKPITRIHTNRVQFLTITNVWESAFSRQIHTYHDNHVPHRTCTCDFLCKKAEPREKKMYNNFTLHILSFSVYFSWEKKHRHICTKGSTHTCRKYWIKWRFSILFIFQDAIKTIWIFFSFFLFLHTPESWNGYP